MSALILFFDIGSVFKVTAHSLPNDNLFGKNESDWTKKS